MRYFFKDFKILSFKRRDLFTDFYIDKEFQPVIFSFVKLKFDATVVLGSRGLLHFAEIFLDFYSVIGVSDI